MQMTAATGKSNNDGHNGWAEYRRLVLSELERLSNQATTTQAQLNAMQLTMAQAIGDVKTVILDKLRETISTIDDGCDKNLKALEGEVEAHMKELESRCYKSIENLKKDFIKQEKSLERTDKKLEKTDKTVTGLKAQAILLGAMAGLVVAAIGVIVTYLVGKQ